MAIFQDLPTELVGWIADYLTVGELAGLVQTATKFYHIADPILYERAKNIKHDPYRPHENPLWYAAHNGIAGTIKKCIAAGFDANMQLDEVRAMETLKTMCFSGRVEALKGKELWKMPKDVTDVPRYATDELCKHAYEDPTVYSRPTGRHNPTRPSATKVSCTPRALHLAAIGGHDEAVEALLDNGAHIDAYANNMCDCEFYKVREDLHDLLPTTDGPNIGNSPIHLAICHFRESTAKLLLKRGAPVQTAGSMFTPSFSVLHTAAATGQAGLCAYLLDEGYVENIDMHDDHLNGFGVTALFWAYYHGHWNTTVPLLLERGADINVKQASMLDVSALEDPPIFADGLRIRFDTLLYDACTYGHFDEACKLIRLGADVNKGQWLGDESIDTPLGAVCQGVLSDKRPPFSPPIQLSKARDQREDDDALRNLIELLVQQGADVNGGRPGDSPLHLAAGQYCVVAVQALLAAGADVHLQSCKKITPLLMACSFCTPVYNTRPYGDNPHTGDSNTGPIRFTSREGSLSDGYCTIKLLLEYGSDVSARNIDGNTALHLLCKSSGSLTDPSGGALKSTIRLLLDRGIDTSARNNCGQTASQEAFLREHYDICDLLLRYQKGTPCLTPDEAAERASALVAKPTNQEAWDMLLDLDTENHLASTSEFIWALYTRTTGDPVTLATICAYMERRPPRLNAEEKGRILCLAIRQRFARLIKHMLALKAPVNRPDELGRTSLYNAVTEFSDNEELANLTRDLLRAGADIHFKNSKEMETPLQVAIAGGKIFAIETMLRHRPLRDDREAPTGVYLHTAVLHGPNDGGMVNLLLRSGARLTELDERGDTPLGCFLETLQAPEKWLTRRLPSQPRHRNPRQRATQACAMIRQLWTRDIDVRARNKADKSILSFLTAITLYAGDSAFGKELAWQVREQIKVVPAEGCKGPERPMLEFHISAIFDDRDLLVFSDSDEGEKEGRRIFMDAWRRQGRGRG